ncbi:hypothetical protein JVT61DRAFT_7066 [Boletus reticuloceps]|uniref:Uncharacterized protein n=1 Tax=Boletus reticuloceps TaxID=495285 RepID=A0A8I3A622_9AGAM|nr:hypothetical protein JVT61DRAFT_7066 [Boletus reticuloceps]
MSFLTDQLGDVQPEVTSLFLPKVASRHPFRSLSHIVNARKLGPLSLQPVDTEQYDRLWLYYDCIWHICYGSRLSSPAKSKAGSTISSTSSVSDALPSSSLLAPPRSTIGKSGTQLSPSEFTSMFSNTFAEARSATNFSAISPTVSSLHRPQTSPRPPPHLGPQHCYSMEGAHTSTRKANSSTESSVSPVVKPDGVSGLRRQVSRMERGQQLAAESTGAAHNLHTTPKSVISPSVKRTFPPHPRLRQWNRDSSADSESHAVAPNPRWARYLIRNIVYEPYCLPANQFQQFDSHYRNNQHFDSISTSSASASNPPVPLAPPITQPISFASSGLTPSSHTSTASVIVVHTAHTIHSL